MSVSARLISVLQGRGDEESEKLQALSEQIDTMQATMDVHFDVLEAHLRDAMPAKLRGSLSPSSS